MAAAAQCCGWTHPLSQDRSKAAIMTITVTAATRAPQAPFAGCISGPRWPMTSPSWVAMLFALLALSVGSPAPCLAQAGLAIVDVNVVPMDRERVLPRHTVLVERGRIAAVGATAD